MTSDAEMQAMSAAVSASGLTTWGYRVAPGNRGPLAYEWTDKPHRLIYDLCGELEQKTAKLRALHVEQIEPSLGAQRWCYECGNVWPCATIQILDGEL